MSGSALLSHFDRRRVVRTALLLATVSFAAFVASAIAQDNPYVVNTTSGPVRGIARAKGGAEFLGIPFAEPPVGTLRWRSPEPKKPWSEIRDAKAFGASCMQPDMGWNKEDAGKGQEDCLFVNVIAPAWPVQKPMPVMVWIHGGANRGGSGSGELYTDGTLFEHGVLVVTFNYRLDILGFFAHPELAGESAHHTAGNYGLQDQILALQWIRDNIARFGGDPNNITVFGQSAGSMNIGMLIASPLARGLFHKAIGESGSPLYPFPAPRAMAEQASQDFAAQFEIPKGADLIESLRKVPAEELIAKAQKIEWGKAPVGPSVDGYVLPHSPAEIFKSGHEAPVPLLLGATTREFGGGPAGDELRKEIEKTDSDLAPQAFKLYGLAESGAGASDPVYGAAGVQWAADNEFHCPVTTEAMWHATAHHPTYLYELNYAIPGQEGALHTAEVPYVFGYYPKSGNISGSFGPVDFKFADLVETYWTNFAKTGDPNSASLPVWPKVDAKQVYLILTKEGWAQASTGPMRGPQCELYRKVLARQMSKKK